MALVHVIRGDVRGDKQTLAAFRLTRQGVQTVGRLTVDPTESKQKQKAALMAFFHDAGCGRRTKTVLVDVAD